MTAWRIAGARAAATDGIPMSVVPMSGMAGRLSQQIDHPLHSIRSELADEFLHAFERQEHVGLSHGLRLIRRGEVTLDDRLRSRAPFRRIGLRDGPRLLLLVIRLDRAEMLRVHLDPERLLDPGHRLAGLFEARLDGLAGGFGLVGTVAFGF